MYLEKDGIRVEPQNSMEIAKFKAFGYREVPPEAKPPAKVAAPVPPVADPTFEDAQQAIVEDALQPTETKEEKPPAQAATASPSADKVPEKTQQKTTDAAAKQSKRKKATK